MLAFFQLLTTTAAQATEVSGKVTTGLSIALILVCALLALTLYKTDKLSKENASLRKQLEDRS